MSTRTPGPIPSPRQRSGPNMPTSTSSPPRRRSLASNPSRRTQEAELRAAVDEASRRLQWVPPPVFLENRLILRLTPRLTPLAGAARQSQPTDTGSNQGLHPARADWFGGPDDAPRLTSSVIVKAIIRSASPLGGLDRPSRNRSIGNARNRHRRGFSRARHRFHHPEPGRGRVRRLCAGDRAGDGEIPAEQGQYRPPQRSRRRRRQGREPALSRPARRLHRRHPEHPRPVRPAGARRRVRLEQVHLARRPRPRPLRPRRALELADQVDRRPAGALGDAAGQVHHHRARRHRLWRDHDRDRTPRHQAAAHHRLQGLVRNTWPPPCAATATP